VRRPAPRSPRRALSSSHPALEEARCEVACRGRREWNRSLHRFASGEGSSQASDREFQRGRPSGCLAPRSRGSTTSSSRRAAEGSGALHSSVSKASIQGPETDRVQTTTARGRISAPGEGPFSATRGSGIVARSASRRNQSRGGPPGGNPRTIVPDAGDLCHAGSTEVEMARPRFSSPGARIPGDLSPAGASIHR